MPESENILRKKTVIKELYKLEVIPKPKNKKYLFRIIEFEKEHSYFHGFEFIKIVHPKELSIGIINNKIVAFKKLILPSLIRDKKGKDWKEKLSNLNNEILFGGEKKDILNIKFDNIQSLGNCYLVFRANLRSGYPRIKEIGQKLERAFSEDKLIDSLKKVTAASVAAATALKETEDAMAAIPPAKCYSINLFIRVGEDKKELVHIIHPRERLSSGLVDISQHVKKGQESLSLILEWTNSHKLSFIGLAEADSSTTIKQEVLKLSSLKHSEYKNINKESLKDGKVELIPGQYIDLEFPEKKERIQSGYKTSFVLKSKGYYAPFG